MRFLSNELAPINSALLLLVVTVSQHAVHPLFATVREKQITSGPGGRILTNIGVWSPDSEWIVFDDRSDADGTTFDGTRIQKVNVSTREVKTLFEAQHDARCGVVNWHPREEKVVFILGPENPTPDWQYGPAQRQGVLVSEHHPNSFSRLDARDLTPPFTPGALRGGSHVHVFSGDGQWVSFTYNDHLLSQFSTETEEHEMDLRNVGVCIPRAVKVKKSHPRNHDGEFFSVLVTRTTAHPKPGSDQISKSFEDAWIGTNGYVAADGSRRTKAIAFQGNVVTAQGKTISEVFVVDLPEDLTRRGNGPLEGTATSRPTPPLGTVQRRLTFTADRKFPGIQGPRHWLRSSPDGSRIAFLMKDDTDIVQLWTVSPKRGAPAQLTHNEFSIASAFTWSPDGSSIAHIMDNSVAVTDVRTGKTSRLTPRSQDVPRPEACVFSPDGKKLAFMRRLASNGKDYNQICVLFLEDGK